ncbi:phosphonate C-P lyase system protein PhnG [Enemella sp. A6]|uniref:phosphonate C-P lyase system protein PhnG n=1 Tax=Enemella sp. A6 TaxID=3440152 RepID=UPI003EB7F0C8
MTTTPNDTTVTREGIGELLGRAESATVVALADRCLAEVDQTDIRVVRPAEVGVVAMQVRDPIGHDRFLLADLLVTTAEVEIAGTRGWAMRQGHDPAGAWAQAVCDAEVARRGPHLAEVVGHCRTRSSELAAARAEEWARLAPTIVEFEEIL